MTLAQIQTYLEIPLRLQYKETSRKPPIVRPKIIREAFRMACKSVNDFKHGAVIYDKNTVIGAGFNVYKTHPNGSGMFCSTHAEVMAITCALKRKRDLSKFEILIVRINKRHQFLLSKPCEDCMNLIDRLGINPVWSI